jgi:4-diphosphocytidyl-2-C-methyl-D-erythritol kinase
VPVAEWKDVLKNDFEESVFVQFPEIAAVKEKLYADGAVYAAMSGSGSAVYGLFKPA